jgi:metal transporter CNNM
VQLTTDRYKKAELKSFLQFHREGEEPLRDDEVSLLFNIYRPYDRSSH